MTAAVTAIALAAGCGGDEDAGSPLDRALGYLPADASLAIAVSTDFESERYQNLDDALQRFAVPGGLEGLLSGSFGSELGFEEARQQLGNDVVVGFTDLSGDFISLEGEAGETPFTMAIEVQDGEQMIDLLETVPGLSEGDPIEGATTFEPEAPEPAIAVDDDVLVIAESFAGLEAAVERADAGEGLDEETFEERLGDLSDEAIVRAAADAPTLLDATGADVASGIPWVASLESFGLVLDVGEDTATLEAVATGSDVDEADLPIASDAQGPRLYSDLTSVANVDQAQTISFLIEAVRASVPSAAFDEVTGRLADDAGVELATLAEAFGEGVRAETSADETIARSEVEDREAVATALAGLKDQVPRLGELLNSGEPASAGVGIAAVLVPALPVPDGYFPESAEVERVPGEPDLYRMKVPESEFEAADEFVFGLIGDVFVSAPSVERARQVATDQPDAESALEGAVGGRADITAGDVFYDSPEGRNVTLSVLDFALEASTSSLRLRLEAGL